MQGAGTEGFHALLQGLQAAGESADHGVGAAGHGHEQHHQQQRQAQAVRPASRHGEPGCAARRWAAQAALHHAQGIQPRHPQRAAVIETDGPGALTDVGRVGLAAKEGIGRADALALRVVQRHGQAQALRPLAQCGQLLGRRGVGWRQGTLQQFAPGVGAVAHRAFRAHALLFHVALHQPP